MDRLTERSDCGLSDFDSICFVNPNDPTGAYNLRELVNSVGDEHLLPIAERYAAYEDTGLEPSEITKAQCAMKAVLSIPPWELENLTIELSAYRTAEEQGLLVRLPCKVGDEIFSFHWSIKNQKREVCTGKAKNVRYDSVDSSVMVSDGEYYRVWGKTVFPTREEAEEALKNG